MGKYKVLILLFIQFLAFTLFATPSILRDKPAYEIKIHIQGLKEGQLVLANYYGSYTLKSDSSVIDSKGWAVFKGENALPQGVYIVALGNMRLFEMVIVEQFFTVELDTTYDADRFKVKGSPENEIFIAYQRTSAKNSYHVVQLESQIKKLGSAEENKKQVEFLKDSIRYYLGKEKELKRLVVNEHPNTVCARILKSLDEIVPPEAPTDATGKVIDSNFKFNYYREHYWDYYDFKASDCYIRTPVFHNKLKGFFDRLVPMHPDSLVYWAIWTCEKVKPAKEVFKYTLTYLVNTYANSTYICMDAVPVNLVLKYYNHTDCYWIDSVELYKNRSIAESQYPTLCNKIAPDISMHDSTLERDIIQIVKTDTIEQSRAAKLYTLLSQRPATNLHSVKSEYTVLIFWDPDCSHCKVEMPKLKKVYEKYKNKGVAVYAACVEIEYDKWMKYIHDNDLKWINVIDVYNISEFRKYYDIHSTPVVFLLDKDKRIIVKKLDADALDGFLEDQLKEKK